MADEVKVVKFVGFSETGPLQRPTTLAGLCSESVCTGMEIGIAMQRSSFNIYEGKFHESELLTIINWWNF